MGLRGVGSEAATVAGSKRRVDGLRICEKRKASRGTARRSVSVRLESIDSVARSLSMFLAVPDRACSPQITLFCVSFFSQRVLRATVRPRWRF